MAKKEIVQVNLAAGNPNLSPATRFSNLVFVAGQTEPGEEAKLSSEIENVVTTNDELYRTRRKSFVCATNMF